VVGTRTGAAREIRAGSGYWSQDSPVQVLAAPGRIEKLQVRFPDRRPPMTVDVPAGAREITIDVTGKIVSAK
jgi:hypothetical protein